MIIDKKNNIIECLKGPINIDELSTKMNELLNKKTKAKNATLIFDGSCLDKENVSNVEHFISFMIKQNIKPHVIVKNMKYRNLNDEVAYIYSEKDFQTLDKLNIFLQESSNDPHNELLYQDGDNDYLAYRNELIHKDQANWPHSQVRKANENLDYLVNVIKQTCKSPLEAMVLIHKFATGFVYHESWNQIEKSRTFISPLTDLKSSPTIVCVGYATLVKALIDKIDMQGLKCKFNLCEFFKNVDDKNSLSHANNFIQIDDKKYDVHGIYFEDPTFDAYSFTNLLNIKPVGIYDETNKTKHIYTSGKGLSMCLYPFKDIKHFKDMIYMFAPSSEVTTQAQLRSSILMGYESRYEECESKCGYLKYSDMTKEEQKSEPIPIQTFVQALENVQLGLKTYKTNQTTFNDDIDKRLDIIQNLDIDKELYKSVDNLKKVFDENSYSNFNKKELSSSQIQSKIGEERKLSNAFFSSSQALLQDVKSFVRKFTHFIKTADKKSENFQTQLQNYVDQAYSYMDKLELRGFDNIIDLLNTELNSIELFLLKNENYL